MIIKIYTAFWILQNSLTSGSEGVRVIGYWDLKKKYPTEYLEHNEIHVEDYCEIPSCPKGAHIVCEVFNPTSQFGSKCHEASESLRVTPEHVQIILDNFNRARGEVAMGKARGKHDAELPRAYGMMKLKWDSELATFAQLLANKCSLAYDHCRATKRFTKPSQTTCEVEFRMENWHPYKNTKGNNLTDGYADDKVLHAIEEAYLRDYNDKNAVTINMIHSVPDWKHNLNRKKGSREGLYYIDLIHANATHVGCGISTYVNSAPGHTDPIPVTVHTILIVCNLSHAPITGGIAYNTDPPKNEKKKTKIGKSVCTSKAHCTALYKEEELDLPFSECGCPPGTIEDENCLCEHSFGEVNPVPKKTNLFKDHRVEANSKHVWEQPPKPSLYRQGSYEKKEDCESTVLLPIITEDGTTIQPEELSSYFMSNIKSTEMDDRFTRTRYSRPRNRDRYQYRQRKSNMMDSHRRIPSQRYSYNNDLVPAEGVPDSSAKQENQEWSSKRRSRVKDRNRQSIFARARKFQLPDTRNKYNMSGMRGKDVTARKDFSHTKHFFGKNASDINSKTSVVTKFNYENEHSKQSDVYQILNNTNKPLRNNEYQMKNKIPVNFMAQNNYDNIKRPEGQEDISAEPHKNGKLLHLINIIEEEIRNSKLNGSERENIHSKIKRILHSLHDDSNISKDVNVLRHSKYLQNIRQDIRSQDDYRNEAESGDDISRHQLPERHRQYVLTRDPSFLAPIDERKTRPFDLPADFSEGQLEAKELVKSEEVLTNDEFYDVKTLEPQVNYKTNTDEEKIKEMENIDTRYRKQNTNDDNEMYKNMKRHQEDKNQHNDYEEDIKSNYGYEDSYFADNDRTKDEYSKNYTEFDYGDDPLDDERKKFYQKKLIAVRRKQLNSNIKERSYVDLQSQPVLMQRRLKNLALSRAQAARYYEPDQERFIQGF